ncbi:MAG: nitroreductase family protein [Anaerolineae bacterium]|nr:nitroreductase family protein [Anaerolineae bacterium]
MNTLEAIRARRSIRRFKPDPLPEDVLTELLTAATLAPSGKNEQPWRFVVVREDKRPELLAVMRAGLAARKAEGVPLGSSEWTARVMEQAPITILVFNADDENPFEHKDFSDVFGNMVDVQSIGAAIQNLLLAAQELGIGSLWICDIFYAYGELCAWLNERHQLIAAISLGYADEAPLPRSRKAVDEVVRWL